MKKMASILMSAMLIFSLTDCSSTSSDNGTSTTGSESQASEQVSNASESSNTIETSDVTESSNTAESSNTVESSDNSAEPSDSSDVPTITDSKVLVVYYSASGNTENAAKYIAEAAGADLFEIVPAEPYTSEDLNWTNNDSRVSREHNDESLRDVPLQSTDVANWDSYDTVFIGYPIWWGIAAWPVDNFVKDNDFSGKTVIPFATSSSSGVGQSGTLLRDMTGTGNWLDGQRFPSGTSKDSVNSWVESLNLNQ